MSKLTRTLAVAATLAAISLAGMTTVAHAQPADEPSRHHARPPTQGQVGEAWHQHPVTSQQKTAQEAAEDATVGRLLARERSTIPNATPPRYLPQLRPNRINGPAGSLSPSGCWLCWCWRVASPSWPPDGQAAGFGPGPPA
jgi:hypothetical protein